MYKKQGSRHRKGPCTNMSKSNSSSSLNTHNSNIHSGNNNSNINNNHHTSSGNTAQSSNNNKHASNINNNNNSGTSIPDVTKDIQWIKKCLEALAVSNKSIMKRMKDLEHDNEILYQVIVENENKIDNLQQYVRRENIEIIGIPDHIQQKDLEPLVIQLLASIGVDVTSYDISACHRLKNAKQRNTTNVIVRFVNRKNTIACLQNRSKLKTSPFRSKFMNNIYIIENLCPSSRSIFDQCKRLVEEGLISNVYTYNGVINIEVDPKDDSGGNNANENDSNNHNNNNNNSNNNISNKNKSNSNDLNNRGNPCDYNSIKMYQKKNNNSNNNSSTYSGSKNHHNENINNNTNDNQNKSTSSVKNDRMVNYTKKYCAAENNPFSSSINHDTSTNSIGSNSNNESKKDGNNNSNTENFDFFINDSLKNPDPNISSMRDSMFNRIDDDYENKNISSNDTQDFHYATSNYSIDDNNINNSNNNNSGSNNNSNGNSNGNNSNCNYINAIYINDDDIYDDNDDETNNDGDLCFDNETHPVDVFDPNNDREETQSQTLSLRSELAGISDA